MFSSAMHGRWFRSMAFVSMMLAAEAYPAYADLVTFDELNTWTSTGSTGSYYNGDSGIGTNTNGWSSGGAYFGNSYNASFGGFWNGFSYSNVNAPNTPGFTNQYAANTGTGVGGSGNYAVAYSGARSFFNLPSLGMVQSIFATNTAYAAYSMLDGDQFAKKFGGVSGNDPDFFSIRFEGFTGLNGAGTTTGSVDFFLADYRSADNTQDYIIKSWTEVNLQSLGSVHSVRISFNSSDVGPFGINTPTFAALDNLAFSAVPEPSSVLLTLAAWGGFVAWRKRSKGG